MIETVHQGDILRIEKIKQPVLVTSKDFFNETGEIIGCPIFTTGSSSPLHIEFHTDSFTGLVHCEKMRLLDLNVRRYSKLDRILLPDIIDITDAIQSIFDYI